MLVVFHTLTVIIFWREFNYNLKMIFRPQIINPYGERLDALVEERDRASATVIFVHGFGTDKHESDRYFDDLSFGLQKNFRIVRFDLSACGKSDGRLEEKRSEERRVGKECRSRWSPY